MVPPIHRKKLIKRVRTAGVRTYSCLNRRSFPRPQPDRILRRDAKSCVSTPAIDDIIPVASSRARVEDSCRSRSNGRSVPLLPYANYPYGSARTRLIAVANRRAEPPWFRQLYCENNRKESEPQGFGPTPVLIGGLFQGRNPIAFLRRDAKFCVSTPAIDDIIPVESSRAGVEDSCRSRSNGRSVPLLPYAKYPYGSSRTRRIAVANRRAEPPWFRQFVL